MKKIDIIYNILKDTPHSKYLKQNIYDETADETASCCVIHLHFVLSKIVSKYKLHKSIFYIILYFDMLQFSH